MLYTHAGALPRHHYVLVEPNAIGEHGWLPAVWFGLVSHPGRAWGCHVLLECGAAYRNVPLHRLAHGHPAGVVTGWAADQAQHWDCYGHQFSTIEYPYLAGLRAVARCGRQVVTHHGDYLFTAVPVGDGFSQVPAQAKEFAFLALDNGRFTAQPTDRVLFVDRSFTTGAAWPTFLERQGEITSAES